MPFFNNYITLDDPLGVLGTQATGINKYGQIVGYTLTAMARRMPSSIARVLIRQLPEPKLLGTPTEGRIPTLSLSSPRASTIRIRSSDILAAGLASFTTITLASSSQPVMLPGPAMLRASMTKT
jgi:hypothetical protein